MNIFNNKEFHINGYTKIDRVALIKLIGASGGSVCRIPRKKSTSYVISDQANVTSKLNIPIVSSEWVTQCIESNTLLDIKKNDVDCNDPNFIASFYSKSRLHFISMEKLQLRSRYLKISQSLHNRIIYYIDFDSFFVYGSLLKFNRVTKQQIGINDHCIIVSNGNMNSEIISLNYVAKNVIKISRNDTFQVGRQKYDDYIKKNPCNIKFHCLDLQIEEYKSILTKFYDYVQTQFDTVIPISVDEGMFFDYVDEINKQAIERKATLLKLKIKQLTNCDVSISVTDDFLYLNKIVLNAIKPDGLKVVLTKTQYEHELENIPIHKLPVFGSSMVDILSKINHPIFKDKLVLNTDAYTIKKMKDDIVRYFKHEPHVSYTEFYQLLLNFSIIRKNHVSSVPQRFYDNIFDLKDDDVYTKNKTADRDHYIPKTISCSINYHIKFVTLWELSVFIKRFAKYLYDRLDNMRHLYKRIRKIGVIVVVQMEGNVVSKYGGMGNRVKRLSKTLNYDNWMEIDERLLLRMGNDYFTLIRLMVNKDKLEDIKGISLQVLQMENYTDEKVTLNNPRLKQSSLNFEKLFKTPEGKINDQSPVKKSFSSHSKDTLVKLIDNEDKEMLSELPIEILNELYFEQKLKFQSKSNSIASKDGNTYEYSIKSNYSPMDSVKKLRVSNKKEQELGSGIKENNILQTRDFFIIHDDIRLSPNKNNLDVLEPVSFQSKTKLSEIKNVLKNWIETTIQYNIQPSRDDVEYFVTFLNKLKMNEQQSRIDNLVSYMDLLIKGYQYEDDTKGIIGEWERYMVLKFYPFLS